MSSRAAIAPEPGRSLFRVALLGNPNTGKTTLFNRLCGVTSRTANFPGTTTRSRVGRCETGEISVDVVDLPGVYRLSLDLPESRVCRAALQGEGSGRPDLALVVLDATNLTRNLALLGELKETGVPVVVALNMVDLARRRGLSFDVERMAELVGSPVVPLVARRGQGLPELRKALGEQLAPAEAGGLSRPSAWSRRARWDGRPGGWWSMSSPSGSTGCSPTPCSAPWSSSP
jgi:ferrous iron transport protein B